MEYVQIVSYTGVDEVFRGVCRVLMSSCVISRWLCCVESMTHGMCNLM